MKKNFDTILDECLERVLRGENLEDCLRDYPEHAEELKSLLPCAIAGARTARDIQPRPEFRARAKSQLLAAVRESNARKSRGFFLWRPVWATVVASFLVFVLASSATVAAAGNSMPDQPLYVVKQLTERARLKLAASDVAKAELNAELADRRVAEIVYLADKGKLQEIESVTERLNRNLERITELSGGKREMVASAPSVPPKTAATARPAPAAVAPKPAPAPAASPVPQGTPRPQVAKPSPSPDKLSGAAVSPQPSKMPPQPSTKPTPTVSDKKPTEKEKLKQTVTKNAEKHPEQLREALKKAPESVKPALRRALAASEKGYKQAKESLEDDD